MSVTEVDFGKGQRDAARTFARLMGILEQHEADILRDPKKYLSMAGEEICSLRGALRAAHDALHPPIEWLSDSAPVPMPMETVRVFQDEWVRLKACAKIVSEAVHDRC